VHRILSLTRSTCAGYERDVVCSCQRRIIRITTGQPHEHDQLTYHPHLIIHGRHMHVFWTRSPRVTRRENKALVKYSVSTLLGTYRKPLARKHISVSCINYTHSVLASPRARSRHASWYTNSHELRSGACRAAMLRGRCLGDGGGVTFTLSILTT
jgi:hypothetical protein